MQFGWTADERAAFEVLDAFAEQGGNFLDTADVYSRWAENNPATKSGQEKTVLLRQIEATDKQIDNLVYELYGLNKEEIAIVEEATK